MKTLHQLIRAPRIQVNQDAGKLDHVFTSCGTASTCSTGCYRNSMNNQNDREVHERRRVQNGHLIKDSSTTAKTQEISHILPGEQLNVFNGEESESYFTTASQKETRKPFLYPMWRNGTWKTLLPSQHMVQILHHGYACHASVSQV